MSAAEGGKGPGEKLGMKKRRTLPTLPTYSQQNPSHAIPRAGGSIRQRSFSQLQSSSQRFSQRRHRRYSDVTKARRSSSLRVPEPDTQTPFFVGGLYKIPPSILRQLKEVERDGKFMPGHVEDIVDAELSKTGKKSKLVLKSGKKLEISVVEGSFRRIAGIREAVDDSGSFTIRTVEIKRIPGKSLGFFIRKGDGWFIEEGTFVSRVNLGSLVEVNGLLHVGDEILKVNGVDITKMPLENIAIIMQYVTKLVLTVKVLTSVALTRTLSKRKELKASQYHPTTSSSPGKQENKIPSEETSEPVQKPGEMALALRPTEDGSKEVSPYEVIDLGSSEPLPPLSSSTPVQLRPHKQKVASSPSHECIRVTSQIYDDRSTTGSAYENIDFTVPPKKQRPQSPRLLITTPSLDQREWMPVSDDLDTCPLNVFEYSGDMESKTSEVTFKDFSNEDLDQDSEIEQYSGLLTCDMYNLEPSAVDHKEVVCAISIDRLIKAKMPILCGDKDQTEPSTFHIDLFLSNSVSFTLKQGILSGSITVSLTQLFPNRTTLGDQSLHLAIEPFGKLQVSLKYKPMSVAVKRMCSDASNTLGAATFREYAKYNPRDSDMPLVVEGCVGIIEEHGLKTPGIYRICASESAKMEAFGASISQTKTRQDLLAIVGSISVHAFTGVIKDFFRTLPEPFIPKDFCTNLMQVAAMEDKEQAKAMMKCYIDCLPDEVTTTLTFLLKHFCRVCAHSKINGMTAEELAKIFGPLMLMPSQSTSAIDKLYAEDFTAQANVITTLMAYYV